MSSAEPPRPGPSFPEIPFAHTLRAPPGTSLRLARATTLVIFSGRRAALGLALIFVSTGVFGLAAGGGAPLALLGAVGGAVLWTVLVGGLTWTAQRRHWRRTTPDGALLGLDVASDHFAVRHLLAAGTISYSACRGIRILGETVVITVKGVGYIALPTELFGDDLPVVWDGITTGRPQPVPTRVVAPSDPFSEVRPLSEPAPLPHRFECTDETRALLYRGFLRRLVHQPARYLLVLGAVGSWIAVSLRPTSLGAVVAIVLTAVVTLTAVGVRRVWTTYGTAYAPGVVFEGGLIGGEVVVRAAKAFTVLPCSSVKSVVVGPEVVLFVMVTGGRMQIPRALLPDVDLEEIRSAAAWHTARR